MIQLRFSVATCFAVALLFLGMAQASVDVPLPHSDAQLPLEEAQSPHWGLDMALFKSFSGEHTVNSGRFVARRLMTESFSAGLDLRYWTTGSYPLALDAGSGAWAAGVNGQFDLFRGRYFGAYVGASFLWVPGPGQLGCSPEAGIRWFASPWVALGLSYSVLTDLGSQIISFEPAASGQSRQSVGLEASVRY